MDIKKIMRQYYESEVDRIKVAVPHTDILKQEPAEEIQSRKLSLENIFGCLVTAGYVLHILAPGSWFSFGKYLISFRFGFLF